MVEIGFFGIHSEDIVMHIAKFFRLAGQNVAIFDEECSYSMCPFPVISNRDDIKPYEKETDVLLTIAGEHVSLLERCSRVVIITDRQPNNARRIAEALLFRRSLEDILFIRDTFPQEYDDTYIARLLGMEKTLVSVPFSENDLRIRCRLQDGKMYKLKKLSKPMLSGLCTLFKTLSETDEKEIYRILRKEGKRKWESYLHFSHHARG